jgi:molybdenum cofactor guanylyltransferase
MAPMNPNVSGAVLAGGRSRRMGRDKRFVEVGGQPLIRRVVDAVATVADEVLVVTRPDDSSLDGMEGVRVVHDRRPDAGPVGGMESAAQEAPGPIVLVVAADMPWLATPLLVELVARLDRSPGLDAFAVATDRGPQPLLAAYRRDALATTTRHLLDAGERRATRVLDALRAEVLPPAVWRQFDPSGRSVLNVNEPADLERTA